MSVQTQINRISNEVDEQAGLIAQIETALEGKSGAGSSVETCNVSISVVNGYSIYGCVATIAPSGTSIPYSKILSASNNHGNFTISNVVVGSIITIWTSATAAKNSHSFVLMASNANDFKVWSYYVPSSVTGENCTIEFY